MNSPHPALRLLSVSILLLASVVAVSQGPPPRIRGPVEANPSVALAGSLNPHIRSAEDVGPLSPDTLISGITLVFKRSPAQEADLQQLLAQQTDPSSPLYRHWLTPADFSARFGIAPSDIDATAAWLQSHGFAVEPSASATNGRITFSGTAAQVQQAFGAQLRHFRWNNEAHFAPASELSLPASLAPVTAAILHLSDFRPKPNVRILRPDYTSSAQSHFLDPQDILNLYDLAAPGTMAYDGYGQSLAIVGQSFVQTGYGSSIYEFQTYFGAIRSMTPVLVPGSGVEAIFPGDVGESEIDLEYSSSLALNANIFFVYTGSSGNYDVMDSLALAITQDIAPVISVSYSVCEPLVSVADLQQYDAILEEASAQGQTVIASSGDTGPTACADYGSESGLSTAQEQQLAVGFPASSPYVTAVGGTQMAPGTFTAGTSQYWQSANGADVIQSLLSYVPEAAWNEDSSSLGLLSSGGGASSVFPRPAWQTGVPGIPSGDYRLVPDIALQASVSSPGYVICTDDPYILGSLTDCNYNAQASNGTYIVTGGTSFGAPIFAAFLAVLGQYENANGFGNVNPVLYGLAAQPSVYSSVFHDIASGTTACSAGEGNCGVPGESGYAATTGYDQATGLGSLDFGKLMTAWPSTPQPPGFVTTNLTANAPLTATAGSSISVTVNVNILCAVCSPPSPPSGDLFVLLDGVESPPVPVQPNGLGGLATFSLVAPSATGSHVVIVRYPGDAAHLPSGTTFVVTVGNIVPSGSIALSATNVTASDNSSASSRVTITPSGGYSGELTWSASYTGGTVAQEICYAVQSPAINGPSTGTINLGLGTACDGPITGSLAPSRVQRSAVERPSPPSRRLPPAMPVAALILCALVPARRHRRFLSLLSITLLAALALGLSGCGGGGSGSGGGGGTQPQVYTLTFTAKDSVNPSITASTSFTLTVN